MKSIKTLTLIDMLSKHETGFSGFGEFLKGGDTYKIRLWQHIVNCRGRYTDDKEDREQAYDVIYKKKTYKYKSTVMGELVAGLKESIFQYIQLIETEKRGFAAIIKASIYKKMEC